MPECLCCDTPITSGLPVSGGWICSECNFEIQTARLLPTPAEVAEQRNRAQEGRASDARSAQNPGTDRAA